MNKHKFAEVFTPPELVNEILEKIETIETIKRSCQKKVRKCCLLIH
jgi:hypothetical protein